MFGLSACNCRKKGKSSYKSNHRRSEINSSKLARAGADAVLKIQSERIPCDLGQVAPSLSSSDCQSVTKAPTFSLLLSSLETEIWKNKGIFFLEIQKEERSK